MLNCQWYCNHIESWYCYPCGKSGRLTLIFKPLLIFECVHATLTFWRSTMTREFSNVQKSNSTFKIQVKDVSHRVWRCAFKNFYRVSKLKSNVIVLEKRVRCWNGGDRMVLACANSSGWHHYDVIFYFENWSWVITWEYKSKFVSKPFDCRYFLSFVQGETLCTFFLCTETWELMILKTFFE